MAPSQLLASLGAVGLLCGGVPAAAFDNMNGEYHVSNLPEGSNFSTNFRDYPGGVEYFEVYHGPINSTYGEVWWTRGTNAIPADVVKRFDGKVMAIVGIEMDQVRRTPQGDVSVPISMAYNHHHDTAVVGKSAALEELDMHELPRDVAGARHYMRLDKGKVWAPTNPTSASGFPTSAMFSDGNGGEYRKTLHMAPPGYAQLVESPQTLSGSPMQVDTWNRDHMDINGGSPFVPGPVPARSLAPLTGPDAIYSGLLECPLTTRIQKVFDNGAGGWNDTFGVEVFPCSGKKGGGGCNMNVGTAAACFEAAKSLQGLGNATFSTKTVSEGSAYPAGCSISVGGAAATATAVFNANASSGACCEAGAEVLGTARSLVTLQLALSGATSQASITLRGPADVWYGVGFGAVLMDADPYAIIVDGHGEVTERQLAKESPGTALPASVTVHSNSVADGVRTVVLTRKLKGASAKHYSFSPTALSLNFINAVGSTPALSYHKAKTASSISLFPSQGRPACLCSYPAKAFGQGSGKIKYLPTGEEIGFPAGRCSPEPRGNLLGMRNPTCDLRAYVGGLSTCHHKWVLLDAEQTQPWLDQPLVYHKKFRIYYQPYDAAKHVNLARNDWGVGADGDHAELDILKCPAGTPTAQCTQTADGTWMPVAAGGEPVHMVKAHFHCHAPACIHMEMWNNNTGKLLCRELGLYGGTHRIDDKRFDEPGYIAMPPCLWGSPRDGLEAPPLMNGMTVRVVHFANATHGHHGEMALPEISLAKGTGLW